MPIKPLPQPSAADLKLIERCDPSVRVRRLLEIAMVRKTIEVLLAAGYAITVNDGDGEDVVKRSTDTEAIVDATFAVDECTFYVHDRPKGEPFAWIFFVHGNSGWDVINDYTTNLETVLKPVDELSDELEEWC